ncbi:MAG: helix-turn-helix transcriptional regulator [Blastocatellia bacterium]|nr:helix-turn-helix transcriptional regulator [Blastocatellia bacterium]
MSVRDYTTFGQIIYEARKQKDLSLKQCASLIFKEDGTPISFQYLSEIENARRNPPSEPILKQLADVLEIPVEILYFHSKTIPSEINVNPSKDTIVKAFQDFLSQLQQKTA